MRKYILLIVLLSSLKCYCQVSLARQWADSIYNTLSSDERIGQLMVVRLSTYDARTKTVTFFEEKVANLIRQYNIGGICVFQGSPVRQANIINNLQAIARTPILMCIDAEWGVGMRMIDSVLPLPHQMMMGACTDSTIAYTYGNIVAEQCKRVGIQVNYAPVVDINNNPNNPVINDRSFGEDKHKVASFGVAYMKGMQDYGVMACAKHFPGHGDVAVDSHLDLPIINKSLEQLDSLELFPFRAVFNAGIGSVMIAHLFIPAIDNSPNRATSLSKNNVTGLMRDRLGYQGLTFTDALEMQGVKKFFPDGEASVQSLIAGNDMLCLPGDIPLAITKIKEAILAGKLTWADIEFHCKKVLMVKYQYGLSHLQPINTENLTYDLNSKVSNMRRLIAENALTVLRKQGTAFSSFQNSLPLAQNDVVYISVGNSEENPMARRVKKRYNANVYYFDYRQDSSGVLPLVQQVVSRYKKVIIGIHNYNRTPANNFGISKPAVDLVTLLQHQTNAITFVFGNPYAIKNWCDAPNLVACYEDDSIIQNTALDLLEGKILPKGTLPVTVCDDLKYGTGITSATFNLPLVNPGRQNINTSRFAAIDSIANDGIAKGAYPGCVVLVAKDGQIAYYKSYGYFTYDKKIAVQPESVYDMASVTKICATTIAVMKLYDEGKLDLKKKLGDYLTWAKGTTKENLIIEDILLHQARLIAYIPFYRETLDSAGIPSRKYYSSRPTDTFSIRVAQDLYMRRDWKDTLYKRILESPLGPPNKYVYSDNDFIFLGKIVEAITGLPLDEYVKKQFYSPMGLTNTGFKPREHLSLDNIVPTEKEKTFRLQLLRGDVHDPGAAMFGGVAGHAGLFSNAYELAIIMQMLLNGGTFNGKKYLDKKTIELFTAYHSDISRRGYGFDKPEKDNATRAEAYPCLSCSPQSFGHTGYTGTGVWADPANNLVFIFLSNRVNPDGGENVKLLKMNIRGKIQEEVYKSLAK